MTCDSIRPWGVSFTHSDSLLSFSSFCAVVCYSIYHDRNCPQLPGWSGMRVGAGGGRGHSEAQARGSKPRRRGERWSGRPCTMVVVALMGLCFFDARPGMVFMTEIPCHGRTALQEVHKTLLVTAARGPAFLCALFSSLLVAATLSTWGS